MRLSFVHLAYINTYANQGSERNGIRHSVFAFAHWVQWVALVCTSCSVVAS